MKSQQRGVALLVVLLLLAAMALLASQMLGRYRQAWQRSQTLLQQVHMREYFLGAEAFVARVLYQDLLDNPQRTSLAQYWASQRNIWPINEVSLRADIRDEQACFNLNSLQNHDEQQPDNFARYRESVFIALLHGLEVEDLRARQLAANLEDWLDSNRDPQFSGAEDNDYMALNPAYLPANQPMLDLSELRAVKGVDGVLYQALRPYVCVLPERDLAVNINTLQGNQARLLSALFLGALSLEAAEVLIRRRPADGWKSVDEFLAQVPGEEDRPVSTELSRSLTVKSDYFVATFSVENQQHPKMTSHFYRTSDRKVIVRHHQAGG